MEVKYSNKIQHYVEQSMKNTSNVLAILVCFKNRTDFGSVDEFTAFRNKMNQNIGLLVGRYETPDGAIICETKGNHENVLIRFEDEDDE